MNLNKYQMAVLYQLILDGMSKVDRKTPPKYVDTLQELEVIFSKYYDNSKNY
jgi:hypothetical protein